jgi:hypothetical protein
MFYFGLDLGQTTDFSAGIVIEAHGEGAERSYDVRYIEQFTLGTSYPTIVESVGTLLDRAPLAGDGTLVIDHTGVGRPVFDMFVNDLRKPLGITITGGTTWHEEDYRQWHVSKIMLVSTVQRVLQSGRLCIGAKLPHAGTLQTELRNFRVKISKAANETYDAREGAHDDLVLALAVALFAGEHHSVAAGLSRAEIQAELEASGHPLPPEPAPLRRIWGDRGRQRFM